MKSNPNIVIGKTSAGDPVSFDLLTLIKTRLLVTANSGGGKSFLLRRLAEQLFGNIPVHIIDPEGEFATLREKFGFVLVGKGGETPADARSIKLVTHKLLELRASAVIDLYEMNPAERHRIVRMYSEAMIDAPKNLWQPTAVIFDEAHVWCPEKGFGESEAKEAVTGFPTRGRKRRFLSIFATQRLAKLSKEASAELLNRLIGATFEDNDLKRAAELLGVTDRRAFDAEMRLIEPGNFYALGRAVCKERTMFKVGPVETTHEDEESKYVNAPPPPPEKIRALLPKLADLPKQAEEQAKTEADLKSEIRQLKAELAKKPLPAPAAISKPIEISVLTEEDRKQIQTLIHNVDEVSSRREEVVKSQVNLTSRIAEITDAVKRLSDKINAPRMLTQGTAIKRPAPTPVPAKSLVHDTNGYAKMPDDSGWIPSGPELKILAVLAQHEEGCEIGKLALLSCRQVNGTMRNVLASLRTHGCIAGENTGIMKITDRGLQFGPFEQLPSGQALADYWRSHKAFGGPERVIFECFLEHQDGIDIEQLATETNRQVNGTLRNNLAKLRTAGVLLGKNTETMRLIDDLFL